MNLPGLDDTEAASESLHTFANNIAKTIDDWLIEIVAKESAQAARDTRNGVQDAIDQAPVEPQVGKSRRGPVSRTDKDEIIDLVNVVFI